MENLEDYPSDSSDEDYVPGEDSGDEEVSDVEEGKVESGGDSGEEQDKHKTQKSKKRKKNKSGTKARKRKGGIKLEDEAEDQASVLESKEEEKVELPLNKNTENGIVEKEKKHADALWASFMQDVDMKPKASQSKSSSSPAISSNSSGRLTASSSINKVTVTKVYDFAGEQIRVTEQVNANSKEAKLAEIHKMQPNCSEPAIVSPKAESPLCPAVNTKQPAGLGSILNKISGKKKMSTLDKSLLDWKDFKLQEGIDEELTTFNKGKEGYLEKQAFLLRADQRQFEVEKNLRLANRSHR